MAAGLETLKLVHESSYLERITDLGGRLRAGRRRAAGRRLRLPQAGRYRLPLFLFDDDPDLRKGFCSSSAMLAQEVYVHPSHDVFLAPR